MPTARLRHFGVGPGVLTVNVHVVFGSGPLGLSVVAALLKRGVPVRLVSRSGKRRGVAATVEVVRGNAADPADTVRLCRGATHVYNCLNAPDYHRWPEQFPPLQAGVLMGAAAAGAKLVVLENLYMYGPHGGVPLTETTPMRATGPRGGTRKQLTEDLFRAHREGVVRVTSARASDFYGPGVAQSLVGSGVFVNALAGKRVTLTADPALPHTLSFISDVGEALVRLGEDNRALGRAWHVPNAPAVPLSAFIRTVFEEAGREPKATYLPQPVTRMLLPMIGAFVPPVRGLAENLYQTYEPFIVDDSAYKNTFGDHATPQREGIRETLAAYRK